MSKDVYTSGSRQCWAINLVWCSEDLGKITLDKKTSVGDLSSYTNAIEQFREGVYKAINGMLRKPRRHERSVGSRVNFNLQPMRFIEFTQWAEESKTKTFTTHGRLFLFAYRTMDGDD